MTHRQLLARTRPLDRRFYERPTPEVAHDLLGKIILHKADGQAVTGRIVETEAYLGQGDLAAHSARGRTPRTGVIFGPPGHAYVYLCYGMYACLNLVAEPDGQGRLRSHSGAGADLWDRGDPKAPAEGPPFARSGLRPRQADPGLGYFARTQRPRRHTGAAHGSCAAVRRSLRDHHFHSHWYLREPGSPVAVLHQGQ